jgi:photosystem II stability/assembly factor-like uncharacterized protein
VLNIPGDPSNNTWLAGAATGGIWRTSDGGATWSERSADFPAMPISSFAATRTGDAIYAGTGECISTFYSAIGAGIFASYNKGITWTQLSSTSNNADFAIVTRVIVNPDDKNIIVATTAPHDQSADNTSAIMRSTNGGISWTKVLEVEGLLEQIIATPSNFNIQYAAHNSNGVWKSTNAGATWTFASNGMTPAGRIEIGVSPADASVIFASAEGTLSDTGSDMYYSRDAGASWNLVDMTYNDAPIDFLDGQGYYDNIVLPDPFNPKAFYAGGVSLFRTVISTGSTPVPNFAITEAGTLPFLFLQPFTGNKFDKERLRSEPRAARNTIEVRFGPGVSQKAHRFMVPVNRTNGLAPSDYSYQDYVTVPFQVWNVTTNKQLMVSFRDQNRNGKFNLVPSYLTDGGTDYLLNSREYIYIHDEFYNTNSNSGIAKNGGQETKLMHSLFPALAENATWNETTLPASKLVITYVGVLKYHSTTETVCDGKGMYDGKNAANQVDLEKGVHADHHALQAIIENAGEKTFKLLLGNDGGVFVSKIATEPGKREGDWTFKGKGFNTGQFYGADKNPQAEQYIGGMQDNGTRLSPANENAGASSQYSFALEGDGFETIWNSKDPSLLLGTRYYGQIAKSRNGGLSWEVVVTSALEYPFVTKLANSFEYPDRVFAAGAQGVYVSEDFGDTWNLTPIPDRFILSTPFFLDVEVSRANANIVWAGSGMNNTGQLRNLHVSTNGGKSFVATNNFTQAVLGNITKLASHPIDPNTAYALFSFANGPKILRTTDLGESWSDITGFGAGSTSSNGFPDVAVYCLYVRADNPSILWAGTEIGIVESQDNGATWTLLDAFPHVTVWDMKASGDEVVIATHGRGIWSAKLPVSQQTTTPPETISCGSTPQGNFAIRLSAPESYDSLLIFVDKTMVRKFMNLPTGTFDVVISGQAPGEKKVSLVGYNNGTPIQSQVKPATHHQILNQRNGYSTHFRTTDDLYLKGLMAVQSMEGDGDPAMQTNHNYSSGTEYEIFFRAPVLVSGTLPKVTYRDIAIVEPGNDTVTLEATVNGLDWIQLSKYDASHNSAWLGIYQSGSRGTSAIYADHDVDFTGKLPIGELALFRFRMTTNHTVTAWGWAIDQVHIQAHPTAVEDPLRANWTVYPNPASEQLTVEYLASGKSGVRIRLFNSFGACVTEVAIAPQQPGVHVASFNIASLAPGSYLVVLNDGKNNHVRKIIKK